MGFSCKKCGCCCRNVLRWEQNASLLSSLTGMELQFPFKHVNGACEHLSDDNSCDIYTERPDICRTSFIFNVLKKRYQISDSELEILQQISCMENGKIAIQRNS